MSTQLHHQVGRILHSCLESTLQAIRVGRHIFEICQIADATILASLRKQFGSRSTGLFLPTSVTPNPILGHYSPYSEQTSQLIRPSMLLKIQLGCYVDRCVSVVATTVMVPQQPSSSPESCIEYADTDVRGNLSCAFAACYMSLRALEWRIHAGVSSRQLRYIVKSVCDNFGCQPVRGIYSFVPVCTESEFVDYAKNRYIRMAFEDDFEGSDFQLQENMPLIIDIMALCGGTDDTPLPLDTQPFIFLRSSSGLHPDLVSLLPNKPTGDSTSGQPDPSVDRPTRPIGGHPTGTRKTSRRKKYTTAKIASYLIASGQGDILRGASRYARVSVNEISQLRYPFCYRMLTKEAQRGYHSALQTIESHNSGIIIPFTLSRLGTSDFVHLSCTCIVGPTKLEVICEPIVPNTIKCPIFPSAAVRELMQ